MKDNDSRRKIGIFGSVPIYALPLINSVNEMKALTGVSSFQGANDKAFPSIPVIAERIGLSESATSTAISGLVRKGLVGRKRNYGKSNTYFLLYETESMAQIKLQNKEEKKKERAKRLLDNIEIHSKKSQSFESLEYSKVSKHEYSNSSNIDYSNSSNDILKEQNKRTELKEQPEKLTSSKFIEYKNRLRAIDEKFGLSYLESSKANQYYEQAQIKYEQTNDKHFSEFFESILAKLEKLTSQKLDRFAFKQGFTIESLVKFDLQGCAKVEAWYNDCYPQSKISIKPEIKSEPVKFSESHLDTLKEFLA